MNLYLFPEAACHFNGYGIAVEAAYRRLNVKDEDVVVWLTTIPKEKMLYLRKQDYILNRPKLFSVRSVINTLRQTNRSEPAVKDLAFLKGKKFETIYCDETCFYHPIRVLFPDNHIIVRFHNSFARIHDRLKLLQRNVDLKYRITLSNMYRLERDVMNDSNVFKVFITNEDRDFYILHYGKKTDSELFEHSIDKKKILSNRKGVHIDNKIIWFGGVESHKKASIDWFIKVVFPQIKKKYPSIEFHLWGQGTTSFNNPDSKIYGHGYYKGEGFPSYNSLYVNPDIIGGGIKIKLMSLLEFGIPVISSPFGFEGYSYDLVDNEHCIVQEEGKWAEFIISYLNKKYTE